MTVRLAKTGLSLLHWRPPKAKINPKELGWVAPDGVIHFQSEESAFNYAKNMVLKALHEPIPYERGLVIKGKNIVADIKGDGNSVNFGKLDMRDTIGVHGHPLNTPLSIDDLKVMLTSGQTAEYAIIPNGQYSKFTVLPSCWRWLPTKIRKFLENLDRKGTASLAENAFSRATAEIHEKLRREGVELGKEFRKIYLNSDEKTQKLMYKLLEQFKRDCYLDLGKIPENLREFFTKFVNLDKKETELITPITHKFWVDNAAKYNVKYETNISGLST